LFDEDFSMAGKTGTARTEYWKADWAVDKKYISSFTGYFPAEDPKYSCIVVIHKPDAKTGFYGADVSGPVFKDIAQKIYTSNYKVNVVEDKIPQYKSVEDSYTAYNVISDKEYTSIPDVTGMAGMDAISILENMGLKVDCEGNGKVVEQSLNAGEKLIKGATIIIKLT
jgi:cell division protein FtsI (penicillin-binding protein 3)